jgi:hypothetical protein
VEYIHLVLDVKVPKLLLCHPFPEGQVLLLEGAQLSLKPLKSELLLLILIVLHLPWRYMNAPRSQISAHMGPPATPL